MSSGTLSLMSIPDFNLSEFVWHILFNLKAFAKTNFLNLNLKDIWSVNSILGLRLVNLLNVLKGLQRLCFYS